MRDAIKKSFLIGLGAASMSAQKAEQAIRELVKSNKVSIREGKHMLSRIKKHGKKESVRMAKFLEMRTKKVSKEAQAMAKKHIKTMQAKLKIIDAELTARGKQTLKKIMKEMDKR